MSKTFQLEFWLHGDAIETKDFDSIPDVPSIGDYIYLACENENTNKSDGYDFKVIDKAYLFFTGNHLKQKIMLKLEKVEMPKW